VLLNALASSWPQAQGSDEMSGTSVGSYSCKKKMVRARTYRWLSVIGLTCTFAALVSWIMYEHHRLSRALDSTYNVRYIAQTGPEVEPLPSGYLVELMGISVDHPVSIYKLDLADLRYKLLQSPCILDAMVEMDPPSTLRVIYRARHPVGVAANMQNALIDDQGVLIPYKPYYRPLNLPKIVLPINKSSVSAQYMNLWGSRLMDEELLNTFTGVLSHPLWHRVSLLQIDLSRCRHSDFGKRELVCLCAAHASGSLSYIRMRPEHWRPQLDCWHGSGLSADSWPQIIDLRVEGMVLTGLPKHCSI